MATRETQPLAALEAVPRPQSALRNLVQDWKREKTEAFAMDLVSSAWVLGLDRIAIDAARFVIEQKSVPASALEIASIYLQEAGEYAPPVNATSELPLPYPESLGPTPEFQKRYWVQAHRLRSRLAVYPRDPITWANLGCVYSAIGSRSKALKAMRTASALAPDDRFVLRSYSRLLLHHGDKGEAHDLLKRSNSVRYDPWILSAEIALADVAGRVSRHIKEGKRILEASRFSPAHTSELASAIATQEAQSSNRKQFKKYLALSLEKPTENAIAQAAWIARKIGASPAYQSLIHGSSEADTWAAVTGSRWDLGLRAATKWLFDQPYSSRPAIIGGEVAGTAMGKFDMAIHFYEQGIRTNPDELSILNNYALCLAISGNPTKARKVFDMIGRSRLSKTDRIVVTATEGLIHIRSGEIELGRSLYHRAIQEAISLRDSTREKVGLLELAFEELRLGSQDAEQLRQEALKRSEGLTNTCFVALRNRLRDFRPSNALSAGGA